MSIAPVDSEWLTLALRDADVLTAADRVHILDIEPIGSDVGFVGTLHRLTLRGPSGTPATVVVKRPSNGPVRALAEAFGSYTREIAFYRDVAPHIPIRVPRCFAASQATDSTDFALVLEDLQAAEPADQLRGLSLAQTEETLAAVASLHAWSWEHPRLHGWETTFTPIDSSAGRLMLEQYGELFQLAWPTCLEVMGDTLEPPIRELGSRFVDLIPTFVGALASPRTLTHGDLRADNLFFDPRGRPILIDFQNAQQECGMREVAYLLAQSVPEELRRKSERALVRRYWEALVAAGVTDYPWVRARTQYRLAVAFNLMWAVIPFLLWDDMSDRGQELLRVLIRRTSAAILDNDSLSLLPA